MTMRFAASRSKPAPIYARGYIKWRQWRSHSNAICNQRFPLVAKHIGGTIRAWNDPSRNRRTDEVPFIAGCSHFTRKNTRFRAPAFSPKHSPCNIHAAITMRSATTLHQGQVSQPLYTKKTRLRALASSPQHCPCNIHAAITMRSATTLHQGQVSIAHHPSRSSLNRTPPFKVKSQSHTTLQGQVSIAQHTLQGQVSIRSATTLHQGHVKSHTTLQGQVSIAHHPSRSSLNRTPPFKVKSQSHTTLQGQVSIAHHPFSIAHHPSRSSLNRTPPFKVKCQSRTTLHHFKTQNSICPYLGSIASQLPLIMSYHFPDVSSSFSIDSFGDAPNISPFLPAKTLPSFHVTSQSSDVTPPSALPAVPRMGRPPSALAAGS